MPHHILLTIDVEDWFQVENLRTCCPVSSWASCELRVEKNTHRLLDLLDSIKMKNTEDSRQKTVGELKETGDSRQNTAFNSPRTPVLSPQSSGSPPRAQRSSSEAVLQPSTHIRATFFVLGWIAERLPHLVREIHSRGHEVASHGYHHDLCSQVSYIELWRDLRDSRNLLEDIIGDRVYGYRAPSFSISDDILRMVEEAGYLYDSSYNSFGMHGRYGKISLNGCARSGIAYKTSDAFYELPISNLPVFPFPTLGNLGTLAHIRHFCLPWGGGAYFRLIPSPLFRLGLREILRQQHAYLFYMHPWEVDPEQPRPEGTTAFSRFKHYTNLSRTEGKLRGLLQKFSECSFVACREHLQPK